MLGVIYKDDAIHTGLPDVFKNQINIWQILKNLFKDYR